MKTLDLKGCRGNHRVHEDKVWEAIKKRRVEQLESEPKDSPKP